MTADDGYESSRYRCPHGKKYDVERCAECERGKEELGKGEYLAGCTACGKPYTCNTKKTQCCPGCRHDTYQVNATWFANHQSWAKKHPKEYESVRRQLGK